MFGDRKDVRVVEITGSDSGRVVELCVVSRLVSVINTSGFMLNGTHDAALQPPTQTHRASTTPSQRE